MDVGHFGFGGQESPILKTRLLLVGLSCYNMEINNLFVLLIHQVPEIQHLKSFYDLETKVILDVDLQTRK